MVATDPATALALVATLVATIRDPQQQRQKTQDDEAGEDGERLRMNVRDPSFNIRTGVEKKEDSFVDGLLKQGWTEDPPEEGDLYPSPGMVCSVSRLRCV